MKHSISTIFFVCLFNSACSTAPYRLNPVEVQTHDHLMDLATTKHSDNNPDQGFIAKEARFRTALFEASSAPNETARASHYLEAGVAVADLYCRSHLQRLQAQRSKMEAIHGTTNIVDATVSAALGLAGASADSVAGSSVLFSALEAQYENLDAAFLVSPDIAQVEKIVFEARDELYTEIFKNNGPPTYYEAERRLAAYHNLCTFSGIKRLVNDAISAGTPIIKTQSNNQSTLSNIATSEKLRSLSEKIGAEGSNFSTEDAVILFAFYNLSYTNSDNVNAFVESRFKEKLKLEQSESVIDFLNRNRNSTNAVLWDIDRGTDLKGPAEFWLSKLRVRKKAINDAKVKIAGYCDEIKAAQADGATEEDEEKGEKAKSNLKELVTYLTASYVGKDEAEALVKCNKNGTTNTKSDEDEALNLSIPDVDLPQQQGASLTVVIE